MKLSNGAMICAANDSEGFVVIEAGKERPLTEDEIHLMNEEFFALKQFKDNTIIKVELGNDGTFYLVDKEGFHPSALLTYAANASRWHFDADIIVLCRFNNSELDLLDIWRFKNN